MFKCVECDFNEVEKEGDICGVCQDENWDNFDDEEDEEE